MCFGKHCEDVQIFSNAYQQKLKLPIFYFGLLLLIGVQLTEALFIFCTFLLYVYFVFSAYIHCLHKRICSFLI